MLPSHTIDSLAAATTGAVRHDACRAERGAVLVHAAVAMVGLLAFSALTIDLGSMWVARAQAQNAADAAALAGTVSLAYVGPDTAAAEAASRAIVAAHQVWGATIPAAAIAVDTDSCPPGSPAVEGDCVNVRVGDGATYAPVPTFFSRLIGGSAANVLASASGKVLRGNSTPCPRPLAIVDSWVDHVAPANAFNGFDQEGHPLGGDADTYVRPDANGPGTGLTVASMFGQSIVRRLHNPLSAAPIPADAMLAFDLPRPDADGELDIDWVRRFSANLSTCSGNSLSIGATVEAFEVHSASYTVPALEGLITASPGASWDEVSPRVITIGVADPLAFSQQMRVPPLQESATLPTVPVTLRNFVGFFLEEVRAVGDDVEIRGTIVRVPGQFDQSAQTITAEAAFLSSVALVR